MRQSDPNGRMPVVSIGANAESAPLNRVRKKVQARSAPAPQTEAGLRHVCRITNLNLRVDQSLMNHNSPPSLYLGALGRNDVDPFMKGFTLFSLR